MPKPHVTRTFAPIHFEDLDPHRFEDLVRQLAYDFRRWQTIESTGRGGADTGFDIRAYEALADTSTPDDNEDDEVAEHPMQGNLWMFQCKREKELGPKRISEIISKSVSKENPPYGYVLAAPVHFSKAAHDAFRAALRDRGVMEFYLWGAGELEDMLYQPKNDHILFAFFGISLATRRRSRTTELRASVIAKNKLLKILGENPRHGAVLVRDLKDTKYPYEGEYRDFKTNARWKQFAALEFHPLGLVLAVKHRYAYVDRDKKEWDFTRAVNVANKGQLSMPRYRRDEDDDDDLRLAVRGYWEQLPQANQAMYVWNGLIRFDAIALIDEKGDTEFGCPHIFVDFHPVRGPFDGGVEYLELAAHQHVSLKGLKQKAVFPKEFPTPRFGAIHRDKFVSLDQRTLATVQHVGTGHALYDADGKYRYLKPTDVISIDKSEGRDGKKVWIAITHKATVTGKQLLDRCKDDPHAKEALERQVGGLIKPTANIDVYEFRVIYEWQIDQNRPVV